VALFQEWRGRFAVPTVGGWPGRALAVGWPVAAALVIAAITWQTTTLTATTGLDPSWIAGLHLAHLNHVDFGSSFVWTYGPLGFLAFPLAVTGQTMAAAFAFVLVAQVAFCYLLLRRTAAAFGAPLAIVLVYVVSAMPLAHADLLLLIVFLLALWAIELPDSLLARSFPVGAGILAGIAALVKTNTGGAAVAIALVGAFAVSKPGRRQWLLVIPSLVVTFAALWLLSGNSLLDVLGWLKASASIVAGYSPAMQTEQQGLRWEYLVAGILAALLAVVAVRHVAAFGRRRQAAILLITLGYAFAYFKEGFVRHDVDHSPYFFAAMAIAFLAFAWRGQARWVSVAGLAIAFGAVAVSIGMHFAPFASTRHVFHQLGDVANSSRRHALVERSLAAERSAYGVPPRLLGELRGKSVHVDPVETAAVGAYHLRWRPLPVPQSYSAYTSSLDDRNAAVLASGSAPQRILRQNTQVAVNGRGRELEAPATFRALLCNYTQLDVSQVWQVLAHAPSRCGGERFLGTSTAASGEAIAVPQARSDELVYARIHLRDTILNKLVGIVFKPRTPKIALGGGDFVPLVLATAADGIVVHVPASAGFDPRFDGAADWTSLAVRTLTGSVRVDFYGAPIHGAPSPPFGETPRTTLPRYTLEELDGHETIAEPDGTLAPVSVGGGYLDSAYAVQGGVEFGGWAAEAAAGTAAPKILVFAGGKLAFAGVPNVERPDVAAAFGRPSLLHTGFAVLLPRRAVFAGTKPRNVRVFALFGDRALEVTYPAADEWHP
jgi:hypothetical protein